MTPLAPSASHAHAVPTATPAGMVRVHGHLLLRRHGLVRPRDLTCPLGHRIRVRGRPYEVAIPCEHKLPPDWREECGALVYVITTRHRGVLWMLDLTAEEDREIDARQLSLEGILERFDVGIPRRRAPKSEASGEASP